MRPGTLALSLAFSLLLFARPAAGFEVFSGDTVRLPAADTFDDDVYVFGNTVVVDATIRGDLVVFGGNVTVNGTVDDDLLGAAGDLRVPGTVGGSTRVAAGTVVLSGSFGEDAVAAGGDVLLADGARVGRDAVLAGGQNRVAGAIRRKLVASGGQVTLTGRVGADARIEAQDLFVGPTASIGGDLRYSAEDSEQIAAGARIGGQTIELPAETEEGGLAPFAFFLLWWFRLLVGLFLLGLILVLALPGRAGRVVRSLRLWPGESLAYGLIVFLLVPVLAAAIFLLGLFIGGWWIAFVLLGAYAVILSFTFPAAGLGIGSLVLRRWGADRKVLTGALALGLFLLMLVVLVPFLGPAIAFLAVIWGLGALLRAIATRQAGEIPV